MLHVLENNILNNRFHKFERKFLLGIANKISSLKEKKQTKQKKRIFIFKKIKVT